MPGWSSSAKRRASRVKRSASEPARRSFNATGSPLARSVARYTTPIAPEPAIETISKRSAMTSPGFTSTHLNRERASLVLAIEAAEERHEQLTFRASRGPGEEGSAGRGNGNEGSVWTVGERGGGDVDGFLQ